VTCYLAPFLAAEALDAERSAIEILASDAGCSPKNRSTQSNSNMAMGANKNCLKGQSFENEPFGFFVPKTDHQKSPLRKHTIRYSRFKNRPSSNLVLQQRLTTHTVL